MRGDRIPPPRPGRGVALVGYRGTGKSTVGRLLAAQMNREFVDVDLEIEARSGRSIGEIFGESGEPVFRDWEERVLAEVLGRLPEAVVATGGGSVLREQNRQRIREFGAIIWLTATPDELARRLDDDERSGMGRPALSAAGAIEEIAEILCARTPIYEGLADFVIETGGKSPEEVAAAILERFASRNVL
jgi:shikimate kinase